MVSGGAGRRISGGMVRRAERKQRDRSNGGTHVHQRPRRSGGKPTRQHIRSGAGLSFNFSYARVLRNFQWASLSVEVPLLWNPDVDLHYGLNAVPEQYRSMFLTPAARLRFFEGLAFQPWVSFGGGLGHSVASNQLECGGPNTGHRITTPGTLDGALGLDVPPGTKLHNATFRFEARDNWSGVPPINVNTGKTRQQNIYVGGGLVFKF